ncbi:MAG: ABC transporter ATP-binding protein [Candidatus Dependentiae bacterium]|nr:ABC transporter ATP-binding protein [Candidatus Dependentiae bacterium]
MTLLCVDQLVKIFPAQKTWWGKVKSPEFNAVKGISFSIKEGENVGLLGSNGAGKTTTIQMLLSTLLPTAGQITYFGKNFFTHRSEILQHVGFASTYARLPGGLTVMENLHLYGRLYGLSYTKRIESIQYYLKRFDLWHVRDQETCSLSAGQKTGIMLAKAFLAEPRIVLLDEPTAALDPDIAQEVRTFVIQQQKERGVSFLFTSHNMSEVNQICDRVLVMQKGRIIANNTPQQLAASVSKVRVDLMVVDGLKRAIVHAQTQGLIYMVHGRTIEVEVDEQAIAHLLQALAGLGVQYTEIGIKKPSLEDYFLRLVQKGREQ